MKKKLRYLYLDDNDKNTRDGDVEYLNTTSDRIEIITDYPCSWAQRSQKILSEINTIDGIILDWELTNKSGNAKEGTVQAADVDFSAESLAEHMRVNVITSKIKDVPIILCSADKNKAFSQLRRKETTSSDLFDLTFIKNDLFNERVKESECQLFDLAQSYEFLQANDYNPIAVLGLEKDDLANIDIRFVDAFETIYKNKTTHDLIQFLLCDFIGKEGLLIDSNVLAARLGIDITSSGENWDNILDILSKENIVYRGLLSIGWVNFWAFKLESWWLSNVSTDSLRTISAVKRVNLLNDRYKLKLNAAEKIKFCSSDEFWTICYGLKRPLDPSNGFLIGESNSKPWLELQYVSGLAELEKVNSDSWRINIMDRENYNQFKALITKSK